MMLETVDVLMLIRTIFLVAPFVLIPLGLSWLSTQGDFKESRLLKAAQRAAAPCAIFAFVSCWLSTGWQAAAPATIWLAFTLLLAAVAVERSVRLLTVFELSALPLIAALGFSAIGGVWLVFSCLGENPLGFSEPIVMLTAVHFHFAGFAALTVVGSWGRRLLRVKATKTVARIFAVATAGVVLGPMLVALGITFSRDLEFVSVLVFAGGLLLFGLLAAPAIFRIFGKRSAQLLAVLSLSSLFVSMYLAIRYAVGMRFGIEPLTIPEMARTHGLINAFGFALPGLLAVRLDGNS